MQITSIKQNPARHGLCTDALKNDLPVLRARVGLSQEVLADKIGISRQTYSSIETGKREMAWTTLIGFTSSG